MKTLVAVCVGLLAVLLVAAKEQAKETTTASPSTTSPSSTTTTEGTTPASDSKKDAKDESVSGKSSSGDAGKKSSSASEEPSSGNTTAAQRLGFKPQVRDLPADILRDFPGLCFASTLCRVFQVGEQWPLFPFCGISTCVQTPDDRLVEVVEDCGPLPKPDKRCRIVNEADRNSTYPDCCPIFECDEGVELVYLDAEDFPVPGGEAETESETSTPSAA